MAATRAADTHRPRGGRPTAPSGSETAPRDAPELRPAVGAAPDAPTGGTTGSAAVVSRRGAIAGTAVAVVAGVWATNPTTARARDEAPTGRVRRGDAFLPASRGSEDVTLPLALASVELDPASGFDLPLGPFRATFVPRAGLFGPKGDPSPLLDRPSLAGMVVTCLGDVWTVESEPAGNRSFALTARAADGADVMTGRGVVDESGGVAIGLAPGAAAARSAGRDRIAGTIAVRADGSWAGAVEVAELDYGKGHGACRKRCDQKSNGAKRRCHKRCRNHLNRPQAAP